MKYLIYNTKTNQFKDTNIKFVHYSKMKKKISIDSCIVIFSAQFDMHDLDFKKYISDLENKYNNQVKVVWLYDLNILKQQINEWL